MRTCECFSGMLSPGELQRLSIARLLYHQPMLALLDEPVSAVSPSVGGTLLHTLREAGISLTTFGQEDCAVLRDAHDIVVCLGDTWLKQPPAGGSVHVCG